MMSGTNASPLLSLPDVIGYETLPPDTKSDRQAVVPASVTESGSVGFSLRPLHRLIWKGTQAEAYATDYAVPNTS